MLRVDVNAVGVIVLDVDTVSAISLDADVEIDDASSVLHADVIIGAIVLDTGTV